MHALAVLRLSFTANGGPGAESMGPGSSPISGGGVDFKGYGWVHETYIHSECTLLLRRYDSIANPFPAQIQGFPQHHKQKNSSSKVVMQLLKTFGTI